MCIVAVRLLFGVSLIDLIMRIGVVIYSFGWGLVLLVVLLVFLRCVYSL